MKKNLLIFSLVLLTMVSGLFGFDYSVELVDSYGDGWNGGSLDVLVNGTAVLTALTIEEGAGPEAHTFTVNGGDEITTVYVEGQWAYENSYSILDQNGNVIAVDGADGAPVGISTPIVVLNDTDVEMAATAITGNATPSAGEVATFTVAVVNNGVPAVASYDVKLMQVADGGDVELNSVTAGSIDGGATADVAISYTFADAGTYEVYGQVVAADDVNTANDACAPMSVDVQAGGTIAITTFDGDYLANNVPLNLFYKSSLSEVIYMANELNIAGAMTGMTYYSNITSEDIPADRPINIWIGETTQTDLTGGWIPSTELTQVFNGTLNFPQGENAVAITFETPYVYAGGNLVVLVERPMDEDYYSSSDKFYGLETTEYENRAIRYYSDSEAGDPTTPPEGTLINNVPKTTFFFAPGDLGSLAGNVSDVNGALDGATVTLTGSMNTSTTTDANGDYNFAYIIPGDLNVTASLHGYADSSVDIAIAENEDATQDFTLTALPMVNVAGTVSASDTAAGVEGAIVSLTGYENYEVTTVADGTYTMSVYANQTYQMAVSYDGYAAYTQEVVVATDDVTVDVIVDEITYPAANVEAVATDTEATVSWNTPGSGAAAEFRYDDGVVTGQLGSQDGGAGVVLGSLHRNNAIINEVSWYLTSEAAHPTANILIFGLDESGMPNSADILAQANDVANTDDAWNTYTFDTPVEAPNGFCVVANTPGLFTSLAMDDGLEEPYTFQAGTQMANLDYTDPTSAWSDIAEFDFQENFLIRANGVDLGAIDYSRAPIAKNARKEVENFLTFIPSEPKNTNVAVRNSRALESYNVYRLAEGDEENMTAWTEIATATTDTVYADTDYPSLDAGVYRYAVVAMYTNNVMSDAAFSNILEKDMYSEVTVNITTNATDVADGASVVLTNTEDATYTYTMTADATGVATFDAVYKGTYSIDATFAGFEAYTATDLVFDEATETVAVELIEMIVDPGAIAHQNLEGNEALITWSGSGAGDEVAENFDAETLPEGWAVVDNDGDSYTWEVSVNWEGMNESAHCMTSASYINNVGALTPDNWLISPAIAVGGSSELHFFVNAQDPSWAGEHFNVKVSTTDDAVASFTNNVYSETIENADWHEVVVDLSEFAGQTIYIAWQHTDCTDMFSLNLDDVSVMDGTRVVYNNAFDTRKEIQEFKTVSKEADRALVNYHVTLDGTEVATTTDMQHTLTNLVDGTEYTVGVQAEYDSGSSEVVEYTFTYELVQYSAVTVNVTTNAGSAQGAVVTLTNDDNTYTMTAPANGTVEFAEVFFGTYNVTVELEGFDAYAGTLTADSATTSMDVALVETIVAPGDLSFEEGSEEGEVIVSWGGASGPGDEVAENFDAETLPAGWAVADNDGDSYTWEVSVNWGGMNESAHCMTSASYINNVGALTPDNWLISPAIAVGGSSELHFFVNAQDPSWAGEHFNVKVSTTDASVSSFTNEIYSETIENADWHEVVVDLSEFAGQTVYIAWQHTECTDMFSLNLDDVSVMDANRVVYNNSFETEKEQKEFIAVRSFEHYEVYLNGDLQGTTEATNYTISGLVDGQSYTIGVKSVYTSGSSEMVTDTYTAEGSAPVVTALTGNYPNPFNPVTTIRFANNKAQNVNIEIYNIRGQKVKTLVNEELEAGNHEIRWNGSDDASQTVGSGVYFYRMKAGKYTSTKKMILLK